MEDTEIFIIQSNCGNKIRFVRCGDGDIHLHIELENGSEARIIIDPSEAERLADELI